MKLMLILLLLITSLMAVVGAFLTTSVSSFYIDTFYQQMNDVFGEDSADFMATLRGNAALPDGAEQIRLLLDARAGELGIDYRTRNYFVLDGRPGPSWPVPPTPRNCPGEQTANLLTARTPWPREMRPLAGDESDITAGFMDVAIPILAGDNSFIIYVLDNKDTVSGLNSQLFLIIMQALIIGLLISVLLSFLLSKTMVGPIES